MSLTPTTPNFVSKSFWKRPEGKTGIAFVVGGATLAVWGLIALGPYIIAAMSNLFTMIAMGVGLFIVGYVLLSPQFHAIVRNVFQLSMRKLTSVFVEIDPIGILKNNLDDMRARARDLDNGISEIAGAKKKLERSIEDKRKAVDHSKAVVDQIDKKLQAGGIPQTMKQTYQLQRTSELTAAGMKMESAKRLGTLLNQVNKMYEMSTRWRELAEFQINNTQSQVDILSDERTATLAATRGLNAIKRLIKGDPEQVKIVNQTLEYLAEDTAKKLGDMDDFAKFSEKFLTSMDIENGAAADEAEKMFAEFEQKLLGPGSTDGQVPVEMGAGQQVAEPVRSNAYDEIFNKK